MLVDRRVFERKLSGHVMGSHCQYGLLVDHHIFLWKYFL